MKNYADAKCCYGYMTLCARCKDHAPRHVNVGVEVRGFPVVACESCKRSRAQCAKDTNGAA